MSAGTEKIRDLITALVKAIKAHQMYGFSHPSFRSFFTVLQQKMQATLDQSAFLEFQVEKFSINYDHLLVYEETDKDTSIAFRFFRDGIRAITFSEGLTPDELLQFVAKVGAAARDQDLALTLWECNFTHINFYVVEEEDESMSYTIPETPVFNIDYGAHVRDILTLERIDLTRPIDAALNGTELASLQASIAAQNKTDLESAINTMLFCLQFQMTPEISNSLLELLGHCITIGDFDHACRIVQALEGIPELKAIAHYETEKIILGFRDLIDQLDERPFNDFLRFIGFFSPAAVPYLISMSTGVKNEKRRQAILAQIARLAHGNLKLIYPFLDSPQQQEVINAIALIGLMRQSEALVKLRSFATHPEPLVRIALIEALFNLNEPTAILPFIDDPATAVRIHALQALTAAQYRRAYKFLQQRLKNKDFLARDIAEQRELVNCLVSVGETQSVTRFLGRLLFKWLLFGRKKYRIMRKLAAYGLAQIGTETARAILNQGARKSNRDIKQACLAALKES